MHYFGDVALKQGVSIYADRKTTGMSDHRQSGNYYVMVFI